MGPWVGTAPGRGGEGPNGVEHLKQWRAAAALLCTTLLRLAVQADGGPVHRVQKGCDSVADGAVADTGHPAQVAQAHLILTKLCHPHHIPHVLRRHTLYSHVSPLSFVCPPAGSCAENGGKVFLFDPNKTLWTPGVDIQSVLRAPVDVQSVLSLSSSGPAVCCHCVSAFLQAAVLRTAAKCFSSTLTRPLWMTSPTRCGSTTTQQKRKAWWLVTALTMV